VATPHYTGLGNIGGFARVESVRSLEAETFLMVWGKRAFFGATPSSDGEIWWFANPPSERELSRAELANMSAETWKRRLIELFRSTRRRPLRSSGPRRGAWLGPTSTACLTCRRGAVATW
jgi:hypothetical protein